MGDLEELKRQPLAIEAHLLNPSFIAHITEHCQDADYWHKFVISGIEPHYTREFILKTVLDFLNPLDLIPIGYDIISESCCYFLARNCLEAILKLVSNKMVIPNPDKPNRPLIVIIIGNFYPTSGLQIDLKRNVKRVLKRRTNDTKLDLRQFHQDQSLKAFCLLSEPKIMAFVMYLVGKIKFKHSLHQIDLSYNLIRVLHPLESLANIRIQALDLSYNEIENLEDLAPLKDLPYLEDLKLDGNPLCDKFCDPYVYTRSVRDHCPGLKFLDNVRVFYNRGLPTPRQNFLCSLAGADLVSQFVEYYFTVYDYEDRTRIIDLYHFHATFSLSCNKIEPNYPTVPRLDHFFNLDRNLYSPTSKLKHHQRLIRGRKNIMKVFGALPRTHHDPLQLKCSLMYYTGKHAVLCVNGIFRENNQHFIFMRNFVLKRDGQECLILNDQMHVQNALSQHLKTAYKKPPNVDVTYNPLPFYYFQYKEVQVALNAITGLNQEASKNLLEDNNYDFKRTLNRFIELHLDDKFPPKDFIEEEGNICPDSRKEKKLSMFSRDILSLFNRNGVDTTRKALWLEINNKRIAADCGAEVGSTQEINMINEDVSEGPLIVPNVAKSHIANSIEDDASKTNANGTILVQMTRAQKRKMRRQNCVRIIPKTLIAPESYLNKNNSIPSQQLGPSERYLQNSNGINTASPSNFAKNNVNPSQQPGPSKGFYQNQRLQNSNSISTASMFNVSHNVSEGDPIEIYSSDDSAPGYVADYIASYNTAGNDAAKLSLQTAPNEPTPMFQPMFQNNNDGVGANLKLIEWTNIAVLPASTNSQNIDLEEIRNKRRTKQRMKRKRRFATKKSLENNCLWYEAINYCDL